MQAVHKKPLPQMEDLGLAELHQELWGQSIHHAQYTMAPITVDHSGVVKPLASN